jgi:hypothetical protein
MSVKLPLQARRIAKAMGVTVESAHNDRGHYRFVLGLPDGTTRKLTLPSSPKIEENALYNFQKQLNQLLANPPTAPKGKP